MDGNHTTAALIVSGRPCSFIVFTVYGPLDTMALLDLRHRAGR
jgi:hypothetical protein